MWFTMENTQTEPFLPEPKPTDKYYVQENAPDYEIGYGPKDEFTVVARTLSKGRALQIANLLNNENGFKWLIDKLAYFADCSAATCEIHAMKRGPQSEFDRHVQITRNIIRDLRRCETGNVYVDSIEHRLNEAIQLREEKRKK